MFLHPEEPFHFPYSNTGLPCGVFGATSIVIVHLSRSNSGILCLHTYPLKGTESVRHSNCGMTIATERTLVVRGLQGMTVVSHVPQLNVHLHSLVECQDQRLSGSDL